MLDVFTMFTSYMDAIRFDVFSDFSIYERENY